MITVIKGYAAINLSPPRSRPSWVGVIAGHRYCTRRRRTAEKALDDARRYFERAQRQAER